MAPNPLRGAAAFLILALQAAPARLLAGEIVLPGQAGTPGSGQGGQAGSISGASPGVNGGVSAIPQMSASLTPGLGVPSAVPAALPHEITLPMPAQAAANPILPVWHAGHAPAAEPAAAAKPAIPKISVKPKLTPADLMKGPPKLPAIDAPSHSAASAGEIDAQIMGVKGAAAAGTAGAESRNELNLLYDGEKAKSPELIDDWDGSEETGVFAAVTEKAAANGLAPASKSAVLAPAGPSAPLPPGAAVYIAKEKGWWAGALAQSKQWADGAWSAVKEAFTAEPEPEPTIQVDPPKKAEPELVDPKAITQVNLTAVAGPGPAAAPAKRTETVVVRSSRGLRYSANGYRVLFARPEGEGVKASAEPDEGLRVRLERGPDDAGTGALREHFARFNALIETNFAALELIAQSSSKMTVKTARAVQAHVLTMAGIYRMLSDGDEARTAESFGIELDVKRLGAQIELAVKGLADGDLLPPSAVALVMPIDKRALHYYVNQLHQKALESVGKSNASSPANLTVKMGAGDDERAVSLVDLSERPIVAGGRAVAPGFKALLAAMARSKDTPKGSLIMQDHQFWGHFKLGAHSAEIYASFLPPDEGGMIRVRYQEWGTSYDNQTRLYYVGRLLHKAGFHVETKNGFLTAVVDKDHAAQTADEMTDTFALVVQALHATVGLDFALPLLVQGSKSSEEVGARIDDWVETVIGEGTLPFYVHDEQQQMVDGWRDYHAARRGRAALRAALDAKLIALGLPPIPATERLGQRTVDRFVNDALEAAIARGQLRLGTDGRLTRAPGYDPMANLADAFAHETLPAARMGEVVSSLDPALFKYETLGTLGGLTVERAQRRLDPGAWVTVYALRDPKTGQIGFARAELSGLKPGQKPATLSPDALFAALREQGHPVAIFTPQSMPPGAAYFQRLLRRETPTRLGFGRRFQGMAASPGHGRSVLARITYDKTRAAQGGYVFVAAYTTPDDLDAIKGAKAVVTTSGGLLSHAAITTREMGIPAAILPGVEWRDGVARLKSFALGKKRTAGEFTARDAKPESPVELAEGALVRLDPATGVIETFPPGVAAPLLDSAAALENWDLTGDTGAFVSWLDRRAKSQSLSFEQKAVLAREALAGAFARTLSDPRAAGLMTRTLAALPGENDVLGKWARDSVNALVSVMIEDAAASLRERRELLREAISTESVERAANQAEASLRAVRAISGELKRPKAELSTLEIMHASFRTEAATLHQKLLGAELSELHLHARLFPAATVEALPRIKAAIAKARRRGMDPALITTWRERAESLERTRREAMEKRAPAALPLSAILDVDVPWVGGKAAKLGEIAAVVKAAGGEVPPGVALTVNAYRRFLAEAGIAKPLAALAADKKLTPDERSARARKLILGAKLDAKSGVGREIAESLAAQGLGSTPLAVRSSAVDEDGAEAAFAGAGDTHLYVDPAELLEHVKDVWASLWNPRALLYRQTKGLSTENLAQAVVVQAMAHSEVSGVAFTQDPVSGSSGRVIVNGAFGLGEGIVSGRVAPDQYTLSKSDGREILPPMISDKRMAVVRGPGGKGTVEHKMPAEWRRRRSMTPAMLAKLTSVSVALERHFGHGLDIEFGFVGDKLYILQARYITISGDAPAVPEPPSGSQTKPAAVQKSKRLMFVCTGNTCRSPMAAYIAREKLARRGRPDIEVVSRGLSVAQEGESMTTYAKSTLESVGMDASGHQASRVTPADVDASALILTMTAEHKKELLARYPQAAKKVFTLAEYTGRGGDVADPYGKDENAYRAAAIELNDALTAFVETVPAGNPK